MRLANPIEANRISRERGQMKTAFDRWNQENPEYQVNHPRWIGEPLGGNDLEFGWPVLVKRRIGYGGRGQRKLDSRQDFLRYVRSRNTRRYGRFFERYIIEEWKPSQKEYRVHAVTEVDGEREKLKIIGVDWKKSRDENADWRVSKNHDNGYIFCSLDPQRLESWEIRAQSRRALRAVGLTMGCVDVGFNPETREVWVFETNARPGVEREDLINAYVAAGAPDPR